jgi:hypothetical protein
LRDPWFDDDRLKIPIAFIEDKYGEKDENAGVPEEEVS